MNVSAGGGDSAEQLPGLRPAWARSDPDRQQPGASRWPGPDPACGDSAVGKRPEAVVAEAESGQAAGDLSGLGGGELAPERVLSREIQAGILDALRPRASTKLDRSSSQRCGRRVGAGQPIDQGAQSSDHRDASAW